MQIARILFFALVATIVFMAPHTASAEDFSRDDIKSIVREYLLENPEVIREAIEELERRQNVAAQAQQRDAIVQLADDLARQPDALIAGNPDGDVTLVEFFDYNCGFCKRAHGDLKNLIESDPNLRVVLKEWPFLGPESIEAARVSLAVSRQGNYFAFHDALLTGPGVADETRALQLAEALGYDMDQVRADMEDPAIMGRLEQNMQLGQAIGVNGTPAYVIGNDLLLGAMGFGALQEAVQNARLSENCATC
ncbi:MAG: DsbA family protein [Pseudomonadota bacterium]